MNDKIKGIDKVYSEILELRNSYIRSSRHHPGYYNEDVAEERATYRNKAEALEKALDIIKETFPCVKNISEIS